MNKLWVLFQILSLRLQQLHAICKEAFIDLHRLQMGPVQDYTYKIKSW